MDLDMVRRIDPEIAAAIEHEEDRQQNTLELIASENVVSPAVMQAQGSVLTNKYAEGYPAKRYYGGCENVDVAEDLAIHRARELFQAEFANVQPHSGSQANMAVYYTFLKLGDTVMGMDLACGGHLTHGSPVSFSGNFYRFVHYGVHPENGTIDYDQVADLARQHQPKMIVAGASAYPRIIDFAAFSDIARSVGALLMVDMAHIAGLVAAHLHPSPIPAADVVTSTTHKTLRGPRGGLILAGADRGSRLNSSIFPGIQGGPLMHVIAAKAVAFKEALSSEFQAYQRRIVKNAAKLADELVSRGIDLVSGGTDNHMVLVDLTSLEITGKEAEEMLGRAGMTVNKNAIPFDRRGPGVTSGIRIGTPAVTSRGMGEPEMARIAEFMAQIFKSKGSDNVVGQVRSQVRDLCAAFALYPA